MCSKTSVCNLSWNGGVFDTQESWRACQAETMRPEFTFACIELQQSRMPAYGLPNVDEWYQRWSELFFSWVGHWWKCTGVVVTSILIHPIILKNIWNNALLSSYLLTNSTDLAFMLSWRALAAASASKRALAGWMHGPEMNHNGSMSNCKLAFLRTWNTVHGCDIST